MAMVYRWVNNPNLDFALVLLVAVVVFSAAPSIGLAVNGTPVVLVTLFQSLAAISITMAGFTLTSITFLIGQLSTRLANLDKHWAEGSDRQIGALMFKPLSRLVLTFVFSIGVVLTSGIPGWPRSVFIALALGFAVGSFSALARNIWLLSKLVKHEKT
jgi:hypothetical protein